MTTAFPEVRLKQYIEMRGADGGPWLNLCALPAFWVGLLYDDQALAEAEAYVADWSIEEMVALRDAVPKTALKTPLKDGILQDVALDILEIARGGLRRRARLDSAGNDETSFLDPLNEVARSGLSPAETLLACFEGEWGGQVEPAFEALIY
jgi:glutamate--cysteine ligase